jgi:two-component system chemotaxis sensor kinase CheA
VGKFQRVVRDISKDLQKRIDLTLEGSETELDKSLLEAVKDPLTHIVRNSCDHGIENPADRKKAGKPETGHLLIKAFHEGGQVVIEVSDDGRGLNRQKITQKAIEKGLITVEKSTTMTDREILEIIFLPGFSTAAQVTSVSGRGVGMDVVKTNNEKIGGSVEISSTEGKGTTLQLRIPLTLAIVPALLVKSGHEKFAIPQVKLIELVRAGGQGAAQIEYLEGRPMYRLRGNLLPLFDIRDITATPETRNYADGAYIVVLSADAGECFGLLVSEILDTADIVVKPLSALLKSINVFSGATILGDGSIALILDVTGVAEYGRVLSKRAHGEEREAFSVGAKAMVSMDVQEFLLFSIGTDATHAIPLCLVQRLEEIDPKMVEYSGEQRVARYRGALLPLMDLRTTLNYTKKKKSAVVEVEDPDARIAVVVIQRSGRNYGIVVKEILDIVRIDGAIDDTIRDRSGILGNIIFQESVVVVVDALGVIERMDPDLNKARAKQSATGGSALEELRNHNRDLKAKRVRVLYAEDVAFFRRHVTRCIGRGAV